MSKARNYGNSVDKRGALPLLLTKVYLSVRKNQRGPQGIVGEHGPLLIIMMMKEK